ncbi:hypothetical protein QOZ80_5AG0393340 [Eleusine coracana subsp. coracana]|nr:hypothetical protein QOZ80_5AG0393340 [Eleusine coracana subsp. coracana]
MVARLQRQEDGPPVYDANPEEFSIQVHHGGFFVGHGHLHGYVNGKVNWFDHVETDTWSPLWLDQFVEDLGYLRTGSLKFYWLLPGQRESQQPIDEPLNVIAQDVIKQDPVGSQLMTQLSSTLLSEMMGQASQSSVLSQPQGPLPEPDFILTNRPIARAAPLTTCTKEGKAAATKRKVTKNTGGAANNKRAGAAAKKKKTGAGTQADAKLS